MKTDNHLCIYVEQGKKFGWFILNGTILGNKITEPEGLSLHNIWEDIPHEFRSDTYHNNYPWQIRWRDYFVRILSINDEDGLWLCKKGSNPVLIHEGNYASPIVIPESNWMVAAKTNGDWSVPNDIVRINLKSKEEYVVNIPPADNFEPIAYLPAHQKVLLYRVRDQETYGDRKPVGPEKPEYSLLDAATGETAIVQGEFRPLFDQTYRPLQSTGNPDEFWAAINTPAQSTTTVGRYNAKDFTFKTECAFSNILFSSMDMWVDEQAGKIYIVVNNDLLQFPLNKGD